ncbi:MAG: insulinase family protein [Erysipelotrichales bacterium]|nr:insulinase family protein [Erysipelotrichales bacterium]
MNNTYNEKIMYKTLSNGLHVILVNKKGYTKSHALFMTPFGAMKNKLVSENGDVLTFKSGLAHFLEHKMFEADNGGDVMDEFSKIGVSANAYTSYNETCYYFTTSYDIEKPLNILLDFVQELTITEESVEKEKGIIVQELRMYKQMADMRFVQEIFASMYEEHPLKDDVGGDEDSVNSVTVDDLYDCYRINYHPQNMTLVIVSGEDSEKILKIIEGNQDLKNFPDVVKVSDYDYKEPTTVKREHYEFKMDINQKRYGIGYKLNGIVDPKVRFKKDISLKMLMEMYFSSSNTLVQEWLDERIINDSFVYDSEYGRDYGFIIFASETDKEDVLKDKLDKAINELINGELDEAVFESIKRRLIGSNIRLMNRFEDFAMALAKARNIGVDFFESIELLKDISLKDLEEVRKDIDLSNVCDVILSEL